MNKKERQKVYQMFGGHCACGHCAYCGCELKYEAMQVDHIAPKLRWDKQEHLDELYGGRVVKGKDEISNYYPSCRAFLLRLINSHKKERINMRTLTIEIPEGKEARWVNGVLTLVDEAKAKDDRPVTERIKTFEDACKALGDDAQEVCDYHYVSDSNCASEDVIAYMKLRIITAALNEGWTPKFTNNEWRYYPWYAKGKWDDFDEDTKRERGVCFGGNAYYGEGSGFVCSYSAYAPSRTDSSVGSHLCFKSSDLAIYAGKQFAALWLNFCYGTASLPAPAMRK